MTIKFGASSYFWNKENRAPSAKPCKMHTEIARKQDPSAAEVMDKCWAFSQFKPATATPEDFIHRILSGMAWTPSVFGGNGRRTNENWIQAELFALDYDNNVSVMDCLAVPFIQQYAMLIHPSSSSGKPDDDGNPIYKTRVIFHIDQPITGEFENYREAAQALCQHLKLDVDHSSYKPAQLYYGSTNVNEAPYIHPEHILPRAVLDALIAPFRAENERQRLESERLRAEQHYEPVPKDSDRASRSVQRTLEYSYRKVSGSPQGARTSAAYGQAFWLGRFLAYWPITEMEIERTLMDASRANGAEQRYGASEMMRQIHNGIKDGKAADPEPLELPSRKTPTAPPEPPPIPESELLPPPASVQERHGEPVLTSPSVTWLTSQDGMNAYRESLTKPRTDGTVPLLFPFKALAGFGGYARILDVGVLVGIVGMSGGMKTSFLETLTEAWRRMDANDILWWGTEWDYKGMTGRAVQRYGGATIEAKALHDMWLIEAEQGIPRDQRFGEPLSESVKRKSEDILGIIDSWPGRNHQLSEAVTDVNMLLQLSADRIIALRESGRRIRVCVWDYIQLLDLYTSKTESEKITSLLGKLKMFCIEHKVIGLVASQVTKAGSSAAKTGDEVLQAESGQNFRSDKFNLVLTLNPVYEGKLITTRGVINVAKNSTGKTGVQTVFIDPSKFKWIDSKVPENQQIRADQLPEVDF